MQAKNWWYIALVVAGSVVLTGCPFDKHTGCSDEEGLAALKEIILESTNKELTERLGAEQNTAIKNALESINFDVIGVRTIDKSSKNTQVFCEATLQTSLPNTLLANADEALKLDGSSQTAQEILNSNSYQNNDDGTFDYEIGYTLQPSDDGKWIYAQLDKGQPAQGLTDMLYWSLSKEQIATKIQQQNEQEAADLEQANANYHAAVARINRTWNSLDPYIQDMLRPEQKSINNQREAECRAESLGVDGSFAAQEIYRLNCEVERLDSRNEELGYY
ncbi:lysozyme inhibitor LprI family protein [Moraxella nasicaprae]|uniref:DUF1311 domain-containing protein n=1 Tax=Moraxella nasicaprae TaxID=2904122 RepID=A0ABY6F655_9GAMM|nr:lysozyme inhibitor LprI family protein [Moraxella nasicaprae]UXZ05583.1 DUF1311 domain-containing protein [Moraxella nasicaprae]